VAGVGTPLHASALLALTQLLGIHAAAEARGELPPAWLLETRVAHACGVLGLPAAAAGADARSGSNRGEDEIGAVERQRGAAALERLLFVKRGATPEQAVRGLCLVRAGWFVRCGAAACPLSRKRSARLNRAPCPP
jgi:hypothetical protein